LFSFQRRFISFLDTKQTHKMRQKTFKKNGNTITFVPVPLKAGENQQMYTFIIEGDEELTKSLLASVKRKQVPERSFFYCAEALFEMIQKGDYENLISGEEIQELTEKFQNKYLENPVFKYTDLSQKNRPLFSACLINTCLPDIGEQQGRTKQQARGNVLKNLVSLHILKLKSA